MYQGFQNDDDFVRSLKRDDTYHFTYNYEYIVNRFGKGDDDVELANATVYITLTWDDSSEPGYTASWYIIAPTSLPNEYTSSEEGVYQEVCDMYLFDDLFARGVMPETFKFILQ